MNFWDHLDQLRRALVWPLVALVAATCAAFALKEPLFDLLLAANSPDFVTYSLVPVAEGVHVGDGQLVPLIATSLTSQFMMHLRVSLFAGLVVTLPLLFYKLFRYAAPGLYPNERRYTARVAVFSFIAFFAGVAVGYFVIFPYSLRFLAGYSVSAQVVGMITLESYMATLMTLSVLMGVCFELPVASWLLARIGVLRAALLCRYRRHAIVGILVLAAVITPTTDAVTLLLAAAPIVLLYELSVLIVRLSARRRVQGLDLAAPAPER